MPLKRKKENPETQSSAPSEESSPMNSQESPCQGLSQASNEESSLMDENKADPSPTQESSNEEQRYQLHLNTMDQQQPTSIPEELRELFPPDLLKAANSLVEDYRRMDPFNTNLREFFSLLTEFTIKIKKKKDSHTRTPGRVKVFSLVTGQTCGADVTILKKVKNCRGITVEETNHWDQCDVIIVFCPISGRPGSDVQDAMSRVQGDSPVILVLMHHTRKPDHAAGATNWFETYPQVVLDVDVLFHDSVPGLLQCERNENTVQQIHRELMERGGSQERGDGALSWLFPPMW